jgi:hypothetical protein
MNVDLDELRAKWEEYDRKLDLNIRLSKRLLAEKKMGQARSALLWRAPGLLMEAIFSMALLLWLGSFLYDHRGEWRFAAPALLLYLLALADFGALIRQVTLTFQMDYSQPVATLQRRIERLKIAQIRHTQVVFLVATLIWAPMLIVGMKGFLNVDAYRLFGAWFLLANMLAGVAVILVALGLSKLFGERLNRWAFVQEITRDLAGYNLNRASAFLATLTEFEENA